MDTWGYFAIVLFGIVFFATRKKPEWDGWHKLSILGMGLGVGILIGVYGAYSIVMSMFP